MLATYGLNVLSILRQPRYLGLSALMIVVAIVCGLAGTWQIYRFTEKHDANHHLRSDAHDAPLAITAALGPASNPTSSGQAQKFRVVTATGSYLPSGQTLLRGQSTDGNNIGYLVITPLQTSQGVVLVARGFVPQNNAADASPQVPAAPTGPVSVSIRLQPASAVTDKYGRLPGEQVDTVNAADQAARLHQPVWNAYGELLPGQPGGVGLQAIPAPDLSNPAGGAEEPQHLAYVVQWYLFGLLALAAPLVMARSELKRDRPAAATTAQQSTKQSRKERRASLDDRLAGRA
ncbi:MAG TPA: SURF1 family protein [Jatrophihabitans sp.]|nr:SURF1 family protein [Jatrophihabitans sp.]